MTLKTKQIFAQEVSSVQALGSNLTAPMDVEEVEVEEEEGGAGEEGGDGDIALLGPRAQVILTGCWTTVKEVANVVAELCRSVPNGGDVSSLLLPVSRVEFLGNLLVK